ncbi:helix-turn-helix transcriptional regulator [Kibdelosporangium philippinense]|uniref:Helix-turn-helix transcriptional regulator n=1 Tax=Kibdelosporangium philippinense TaxID=211113 RepID=A0ABS8Z8Q1_9PSEU|nr:helix-turn-helix transcriptional regulator [Kibdelosporangium philippinense]MCE7004246.1 helix-turn-helix transcriptional regulator [Kibdelosporangium philippinense]
MNIGMLLEAATSEVVVMSSLSCDRHDPISSARLAQHVRPGVRYRVLVPDWARVMPVLGALTLADAIVRTVPHVPSDALVVDRHTVLVPADQARLAVFQLPAVVTTTLELFEQIWPRAVPLFTSDLPDSAELTVRQREILTLLWEGHTDESAAARLEISVRTVRRSVAEIMSRLGARSRFQAGAKAADRGWLLADAS